MQGVTSVTKFRYSGRINNRAFSFCLLQPPECTQKYSRTKRSEPVSVIHNPLLHSEGPSRRVDD